MKGLILLLINVYQKLISPYRAPSCRFYPSCSAYAKEVFNKYGVPKGIFVFAGRLLRCQPFHPGGYDPV